MNNVNALYNNHATYNGGFDQNNSTLNLPNTSVPYNNINPSNLDLSQFQNPQLRQRLNDANFRTQSPSFQHPAYQVNPIVPAKRSRPGEDNLGVSPRPATGTLGISRAQTPHQIPFVHNYNSHHGGPAFQAATPYQHIQQVELPHASSSPVPQTQPFGSQAPSLPRVQTHIPHQFPGNNLNPGDLAQFQHNGVRLNHPQNAPSQPHLRGLPLGPAFNQQTATPLPGIMSGGTIDSLLHGSSQANTTPQFQEMQRRYTMQLQQTQQNLHGGNSSNYRGQQPSPPDESHHSWTNNTNGQMGVRTMQPQMQSNATSRNSEQTFMSTLSNYMQAQGKLLDPDPRVCGRPINYYQLFICLSKHRVLVPGPNLGKWQLVSAAMGFPENYYPNAAGETLKLYQQNLQAYVGEYWRMMQRRKMQMMQQQAQARSATGGQFQRSPPQSLRAHAAQQPVSLRTSNAQDTPMQANISLPDPGGFATPQRHQSLLTVEHHQNADHRRSNSGRLTQTSPLQLQHPPIDTLSAVYVDSNDVRAPSSSPRARETAVTPAPRVPEADWSPTYKPKRLTLTTHGGFDIHRVAEIGDKIREERPIQHSVESTGTIDIHTITMRLQSGIHGELRKALDHLVLWSSSSEQILLDECIDLVDSLIVCAEEQLELLIVDAAEVSDVVNLTNLEELSRASRSEMDAIQDTSEFTSLRHELDHAADRFTAISAILRNLSFHETDHNVLTGPTVVSFISNVIRLLGTRNMLLRTACNTHDFMKDIVTFLSNTADKIELGSKADAVTLLHFLLAFAPKPPPIDSTNVVRFSSYNPAIHHYLPAAIDSLAKLLARDDPNRSFYKTIFHDEHSSTPPYKLLTRAFALAICPIPDRSDKTLQGPDDTGASRVRQAFFSQGMLAADILASLAPRLDSPLARSWLESEDGWAPNLLHVAFTLATSHTRLPPQRQGSTGRIVDVEGRGGFSLVTHRALSMLLQLAEKTERGKDGNRIALAGISPSDETLLSALIDPTFDTQILKQLMAFARLAG